MASLTLTALAENIYRARDTVARELVGFLPAVLTNSDTDEVSINGTVNSIVTEAPTVNESLTPAMAIPEGDSQTIGVEQMSLDSVANVRIPITGENARKLNNLGQYQTAIDQMFAQAIRALVNKVESKVALKVLLGGSRATGTAGTAPFGSTHAIINDARKILVDNGAGSEELRAVIDTTAGVNFRNLSNLFKANEAGSDAMLRNGTLLILSGMGIGESDQVQSHTKGTGAGYLVDLVAGYAVGDTTIHVDTGTGTIVAGDVITFEDDANKYIVKTGFAGDGDGDIVLQAPGLRQTLANNVAATIGASYTANSAFRRDAVELALRPYAVPEGGDAATDRIVIADDMSPLVFDVNLYKGYKMNLMEINCVYGAKVWKPDFVTTILG